MSARSFGIFIALLAVIGLLGFGLVSEGEGSLAVGDRAPTDALPVLEGEGQGSLADYRGQWVLINVWASWCGPCRDEAPALERFYRRAGGERFEVLGIDTQETAESGREFVEEFDLTYPQLHDGDGEYAEALKTTGVPENFLVDPAGEIAFLFPGPVSEELLETEIARRVEG